MNNGYSRLKEIQDNDCRLNNKFPSFDRRVV